MSTITRERLEQLANFRGAPVTRQEEQELARIALASLEAEAVAWLLSGGGAKNNVSFDSGNAYVDPLREVTPLYTAPPAPVSMPDESAMFDAAIDICRKSDAIDEHVWNHGVLAVMSAFSDCRAAILKHSEPFIVTSDHRMMEMPQVEAINAVTAMLQGVDGNAPAHFRSRPAQSSLSPAQGGNSPVIPEGWVMVPIEPTADMREAYHQAQAEYEDVDGLWSPDHQWQAMLAAAPHQE
ncbi:Uncharacterised protein [Enterobacter hormaechei]|jgi:hypothetical protein|uniref:hypothetical protein n=1 Tax=Enterobacter cloacae complex TaxID=354276 RepID=UPI000D704A23|nr:hypothetical protein [Enterobacter hormaechei]DAL55705.1 MAG TPA_asm: hypothetical protein [Caudoviricetes sp.]HCM9747943.1 hypothetical protein [Enterobacter hormaechei subsp. steigerwaltii]ELT1812286.1 hypothetical protein [Enterobacter hormaechei]VAE52215.1 Uncharacterised protein [Enterobacter hormaechei]VAE96446.1 Uncharacterised protein [Enterobacter hormaechei]